MLLNLQPYFATYKVTEITEVWAMTTACTEAMRENLLWVFSVNSVSSVAKVFLDRRF